jgi:mutator family transposase
LASPSSISCYCVVDGQKVPIRRTRLRTADKREQRLGSYELFQRSGPMQSSVWDKIMRGLSTRNYGAVVKDLHGAYGIERSAVSEKFIEVSREKVKELMERPLGELRLCAVLIDGLRSRTGQMIVALGIGCDGRKTVLGPREGATENTAVVNGLLSELVERGFIHPAAVYSRRWQGPARGSAPAHRRGRFHPALPSQAGRACSTPPDLVLYQRNRVGLLDRGDRLPKR